MLPTQPVPRPVSIEARRGRSTRRRSRSSPTATAPPSALVPIPPRRARLTLGRRAGHGSPWGRDARPWCGPRNTVRARRTTVVLVTDHRGGATVRAVRATEHRAGASHDRLPGHGTPWGRDGSPWCGSRITVAARRSAVVRITDRGEGATVRRGADHRTPWRRDGRPWCGSRITVGARRSAVVRVTDHRVAARRPADRRVDAAVARPRVPPPVTPPRVGRRDLPRLIELGARPARGEREDAEGARERARHRWRLPPAALVGRRPPSRSILRSRPPAARD